MPLSQGPILRIPKPIRTQGWASASHGVLVINNNKVQQPAPRRSRRPGSDRGPAPGPSHEFLNEPQRTAIREVLTSTDRVHGFQGTCGHRENKDRFLCLAISAEKLGIRVPFVSAVVSEKEAPGQCSDSFSRSVCSHLYKFRRPHDSLRSCAFLHDEVCCCRSTTSTPPPQA